MMRTLNAPRALVEWITLFGNVMKFSGDYARKRIGISGAARMASVE
jgi:hypothetical protein